MSKIPVEAIRATLAVVRASLARSAGFGAEVAALDVAIDLLSQPETAPGPERRAFPSHRQWQRLRLAVFERDGWRCVYCGAPIDIASGHADHVMPRSRGGSDEIDNLAAACGPCNLDKGAKTPGEWRQ